MYHEISKLKPLHDFRFFNLLWTRAEVLRTQLRESVYGQHPILI